jgi:DNA-binding NarL/FixJ family response regulator
MVTTILIADHHRMLRETLRQNLEGIEDFEVVADTGDGRSAVRLCEEEKPDIAVLDIDMPEMNGIEATRMISRKSPDTSVVALTNRSSLDHIAGMLAAGASAYLLKECAFEDLTRAVRLAAGGKTYLCPEVTGCLVDDYIRYAFKGKTSRPPALAPREREVLQLIAEGRALKEIASVLGVSRKTVENHKARIMEKLGTRSTAGLTKYAIREGITTLEG